MRTMVMALMVCVGATAFAKDAAPPKASFVKRLFGIHPKEVRTAIRDAKRMKTGAEQDEALTAFVKANAGSIPMHSLKKIASKTTTFEGQDRVVKAYAKSFSSLSFKQMKQLVKKTGNWDAHRELAKSFLEANKDRLTRKQARVLERMSHETEPATATATANNDSGYHFGVQTNINLQTGQITPQYGFGNGITFTP